MEMIMLRAIRLGVLLTGILVAASAPAHAYTGEDPRPVSACDFPQFNVTLSATDAHGYDFVAICSGYSFVGRGSWDPVTNQTAERITMGDWRMSSTASCDADPWTTAAPCRDTKLSASA